jgi:TonB dependent receptor
LNLSVYHKDSINQQDNNNFFNTGIIFPVTLAKIRVNGAEARLVLPTIHGFTGSLSGTHARAISTGPFTGGLFIGQGPVNLLDVGPFVIDHDQKLSVSANGRYTVNRHWWASAAVRYDSGLVANPSDPAQVAADPDYSDLLPYVNLRQSVPRVRPHTISDFAIGYEAYRGNDRAWNVQVQVNNIFNTTALHLGLWE